MTMTNLIDDLIAKHCPTDRGGWVPAIEAGKIINEALASGEGGRADWFEWLDQHGEQFLTGYINKRKPRTRISRTEQFQNTLAYYQQHSCAGNVVKVAHEMTATDHEFVARRYGMAARTALMLEAFHNAVASKLGPEQVTSDVFDEDTYEKMLTSIAPGVISPAEPRQPDAA
jgi:hypothetical protein